MAPDIQFRSAFGPNSQPPPCFVQHLLNFSDAEIRNHLAERGEPAYRAAQIRRWMFERRAADFDAMSDLPKRLRAELSQSFCLWTTRVVVHHRTDDGTEKLLLELADGHRIECVLLREGQRRTICISTQVGCAMGCVFCASGLDGVVRNLSTGEIVEQMLRLDRLLPTDERLSHIVVMGMGEPLANLGALIPALAEAHNPAGLGISARRITISTVGLPPAIRRLAEENHPYHLAVSLHAPDDGLRNRLVPVNRQIGLADILAAAEYFFGVTGRRVTFEYVLLGDVNDQPEHAHRLAELLAGRRALLNVIPYNNVAGLPYQRPNEEAIERFCGCLRGEGLMSRCGNARGTASTPPAGNSVARTKVSSRSPREPCP